MATNETTNELPSAGHVWTASDRRKLSAASGCSLSTIGRWERGEAVRVSTKTLLDMCARRNNIPVPKATDGRKT